METPHFYCDSKYTIGDSTESLYNWIAVIREMCVLAAALFSTVAGMGQRGDAVKLYNMAMKTVRGGGPPANRGCGNLDFPAGSLRAPLTVFRPRLVGQVYTYSSWCVYLLSHF